MYSHAPTSASLSARQIVLQHLVSAPPDVVFRAFTRPEHVVHWWGPFGFRNTHHVMDVRPGGVWRLTMHGPDGTDYPNLSRFTDVVPDQRLAFTHGSGRPGEPGFDVVVTFSPDGPGTRVVLCQTHPTVEQARAIGRFAVDGGMQTLARLDGYLATMRERVSAAVYEGASGPEDGDLVVSRVFAAPLFSLWSALTDPARIERWFGPAGLGLRVVSSDLRPGGELRYAMQPGPDETRGRFVYREIAEPLRLAYVVSFADEQFRPMRHPLSASWPLEVLSIVTLTPFDGKTVLFGRALPIHASDEEIATFRAGHASMVHGWTGTYDQLERHLVETR